MEANNEFIQKYAPVVRIVVKQYSGILAAKQSRAITQEDLQQEGYIGLIEAAGRFNPNMGCTFESFASWWIRKYVQEAIRRYAYIVKLPQHKRTTAPICERLDRQSEPYEEENAGHQDLLRGQLLQPDQALEANEAIEAWNNLKKQQKSQKKRIDVGKFKQKYVYTK